MRQIVLDTETTGLDPAQGHRLVEVAAVELLNRRLTGRHFHYYLNPERAVDAGALQVHGLSNDFLADKPKFADIVDELLDYVQGGELVIHNAAFDVGFLNAELSRLQREPIQTVCPSIVDTLKLARDLYPGKRNNLDALCERCGVDNSGRTLHGALLDAELLAEVYLAMTRGQETLVMEIDLAAPEVARQDQARVAVALTVQRASAAELQEHAAYLDALDKAVQGSCLWRQLEPQAEQTLN